MPIILAFTRSPAFTISRGFSMSCQANSEIWTRPSSFLSSKMSLALFGANFINAPKSTTPEISPVTISPTERAENISRSFSDRAAFSLAINFSVSLAPLSFSQTSYSLKKAGDEFSSKSKSASISGLGNFASKALKTSEETFQIESNSPSFRSLEKANRNL